MNLARILIIFIGTSLYTSAWWAIGKFGIQNNPVTVICAVAVGISSMFLIAAFIPWAVENW